MSKIDIPFFVKCHAAQYKHVHDASAYYQIFYGLSLKKSILSTVSSGKLPLPVSQFTLMGCGIFCCPKGNIQFGGICHGQRPGQISQFIKVVCGYAFCLKTLISGAFGPFCCLLPAGRAIAGRRADPQGSRMATGYLLFFALSFINRFPTGLVFPGGLNVYIRADGTVNFAVLLLKGFNVFPN